MRFFSSSSFLPIHNHIIDKKSTRYSIELVTVSTRRKQVVARKCFWQGSWWDFFSLIFNEKKLLLRWYSDMERSMVLSVVLCAGEKESEPRRRNGNEFRLNEPITKVCRQWLTSTPCFFSAESPLHSTCQKIPSGIYNHSKNTLILSFFLFHFILPYLFLKCIFKMLLCCTVHAVPHFSAGGTTKHSFFLLLLLKKGF